MRFWRYLRPVWSFLDPFIEFIDRAREMRFWGYLSPVWSFLSPFIEFFMPFTVTYIVLWLVLRPNHVRPHVDTAMLNQFNFTNTTSTLEYDIAVDLSFSNSHKHLNARYLDLSAATTYGGTRLGPSVYPLPVFVQHGKEANVVHAVFKGSAAHLDPAAAEVFGREAANGSFNILVKVSSTFMYKIPFVNPVYYYDHQCLISFPQPHNGTPAAAISTPEMVCTATAR